MQTTGKYKGRPSNVSLARRRNELSEQSDQSTLKWITDQIDDLNPGQHIRIESRHTFKLNKRTVLAFVYRSNMQHNTNFKFHTDKKSGDWFIWFDPTPKPAVPFFLQSHTPPIPKAPNTPTKPKQPKQPAGSIHATLQQICEYWHTSPESFDRLPFDVQLKKKIQAGIAIRAKYKLNQTFNTKPKK